MNQDAGRDMDARIEPGAAVVAELERMEERLRTAMEAGNVAELEALIDERLRFVGPDGRVCGKQDDLGLYRSDEQRLSSVVLRGLEVEVHGGTAVAVVEAELDGVFRGAIVNGRHRYLRAWSRSDAGWRIIAGSVCALPRGDAPGP